jgi:arginine/ornithine transport system substrate-binding protein
MPTNETAHRKLKRLAAIGAVLLVIAGLYVWYSRARESWYSGAYANGHLLRIAVKEDDPPFGFLDGEGGLAGFDVDIARAICQRLQVTCQLVPQNWTDNLFTSLIDGRYDAVVSSLAITSLPIDMIEPGSVRFTDKYYSFPATISCCGREAGSYVVAGGQPKASWRFVARKGAVFEISPAGLVGKRIGYDDKASYDYYMRSAFPDAVRVKFRTQAAANLDMAAGRLDLLLADSRILSETFLNTALGREFEFIGPAVTDPELLGSDAGIAVRREDIDLLRALNQALAAIRADGTYKTINDRYFDFDIYSD